MSYERIENKASIAHLLVPASTKTQHVAITKLKTGARTQMENKQFTYIQYSHMKHNCRLSFMVNAENTYRQKNRKSLL